jgi:hypothetical protein
MPRQKVKPVVLQVIESDGRGPRVFRRVHDYEEVAVENEMAFWVVFADADVVDAPKPH